MPIRISHIALLVSLFTTFPATAEQLLAQSTVAMPAPETIRDNQEPSNTPAMEASANTATTPNLKPSAGLNTAGQGDLWDRIREGFALAETDSELVRAHEQWFANRPEYIRRTIERSKRYMFHIVEEVEKRGMPTEIALLPFIESAYNPKALSPAQASGIWQFIPSTGKNYGLEQNWWYDGRRDILAATDAALDYLQTLYKQFGSWELALAAYNYGENGVARAIARNQVKGEPTDYVSLRLPAETRQYVPKLVAVRNIVFNPGAFGLSLTAIPNTPYFTTVTLNQHIDVKLAAQLAEIPLTEFVALNPAFNRPVVSATSPRTVLLPVDKLDDFNSNLENYSRPLVSWQSYHAKKGERIDAIARKFGTTVSRLQANNQLRLKRNKLVANELLLVPLQGQQAPAISLESKQEKLAQSEISDDSDEARYYVVKKGDTILSIAKRHHIDAKKLKAANGMKTNRLALGQKLLLSSSSTTLAKAAENKRVVAKLAPAKASKVPLRRTSYTVRRGDTVASIARRFKIAEADIQRWNNLSSPRDLARGSRLTLFLVKKS